MTRDALGTRYAKTFAGLASRGEAAFVPFLVLGDPDLLTTLELVRAVVRGGADALELGLPFSDPIADGPVIQAAATRALAGVARVADTLVALEAIRRENPSLPIGLLVYANLVLHRGADTFYKDVSRAGVDSVLVADLPLLEARAASDTARAHGVAPVFIAPPTSSEATLAALAAASEGYVYVTSRPGVTGADQRLSRDSTRLIATLKSHGAAPALLGFGISRPEHMQDAIAMGAAGAISGSAVVARVAAHLGDRTRMVSAVEEFTREMKAAARRPGG